MPYNPTSSTAVHALDQTQQLAANKQYSWLSGADVTLTGSTSSIETTNSAGIANWDGETIDIASANHTHPTGDTDDPRWDALCVTDRTGTVEVFSGIPAPTVSDDQGNPQRGEAAFSPAPSDNITAEMVCLALVWIPSGATTNNDLTDETNGGVANPVVDRRIYQAGQVNQTTKRATITSSGWKTIASQAPLGTGPSTSKKLANALFTVRDTQAGRNSAMSFWASYHDGTEPTITVPHASAGGDIRAIQGVRIVSGGAGDGAEVQINVQLNTNSQVSIVEYTLQNNYHYGGWHPESWQDGVTPSGYDSTDIYWRSYDHILATSTDNSKSAQFSVNREGDVSANDVDRDTIGVRGYLSADQSVPSNTYTQIGFDSIKFSNMDGFDSTANEFVAPVGGYYRTNLSVSWVGMLDSTRVVSYIAGPTGTEARAHTQSGSQDPLTGSVSDVVDLSAGSTVKFATQQYSGSSQSIDGNAATTYFSIMKLG